MVAPKVSVVMASYNRCALTVRSIEAIYSQKGLGTSWEVDIFLLDDASIDNTAETVRRRFPKVHLLEGTGSLYWGGGMSLAMEHALERKPDFILMLNDDVVLLDDAIDRSLSDYRHVFEKMSNPFQVIVGAVTDPNTGKITYSGFIRTSKHDPSKIAVISPRSEGLSRCDTMNGNFVLIPKVVSDVLGTIDPVFIHQLGDVDYGYRVVASGGSIMLSSRPVGTCPANKRELPYRKKGLSLIARCKALNSPMGLPFLPWITFMWRWGGCYGVFRLSGIYLLRLIGR